MEWFLRLLIKWAVAKWLKPSKPKESKPTPPPPDILSEIEEVERELDEEDAQYDIDQRSRT